MTALGTMILAALSAINVGFYAGAGQHWWNATSAVFCGIYALRLP